jgi:hypothetical protein
MTYIFKHVSEDGTVIEHTYEDVQGPKLTEDFFCFLAGCSFILPAYPSTMTDAAWDAEDEVPKDSF